MLEMKVTVTADAALLAAISNLANAVKAAPVQNEKAAAAPVQPVPVTPVTPVPVTPVQPAPVVPAPAPVQPAPVPTAVPQYTLDMIATAGASLVDAGMLDPLMGVLAKYNVQTITQLNPGQYGAVATDLRALGARI